MTATKKYLPELLCIGHMCHDRVDTGYRLGGTVSYASLMSAHLGVRTALMTSVGEDFKYWHSIQEQSIQTFNILAERTTEFENIYSDTGRTQFMHERAQTISAVDIPDELHQAPTVKLCLIADELDSTVVPLFANSFVAASIQGWLRQRDHESGLITPKALDYNLLSGIDMIFLSLDDIDGDESELEQLRQAIDTVIVTDGANPVRIYRDKAVLEMPVFPVEELDPTGAGDIFAASFLVQYRRTQSLLLAGAYAHSATSYAVEHQGIFLAPVADIESRYASYIDQFLS